MAKNTLRNKIKKLGKQIGIIQTELGKYLNLSSSKNVSLIESGKRKLKLKNILKCADFFGIDACYLISNGDYSEKELKAMIGSKKLVVNGRKSKAMKLRYEKVIEQLTEDLAISNQKDTA